MAGIDPHEFAAGLRFELDIQRIADDKCLQKVLVRGLNSELRQDESADSFQRRLRRIVRSENLRRHFAQTLDYRGIDQLVFGIEVEVDGALGDLRLLGDAIDGGAMHAVSSHRAACGIEDLPHPVFLDYFFLRHEKTGWSVK